MKQLLSDIRKCTTCLQYLEHGVNPVLQAGIDAKIVIIGQAPGSKVHQTGIPWDDASGNQLRKWLGIDKEVFYDADKVALIPMGFCYPGKGKSGDLPPRQECAPQWHHLLLSQMRSVKLTLLIGQYAQSHYLGERMKSNLTETVSAYEEYLPQYLPLPHPSPRNRFWLKNNPWFEEHVVPYIQQVVMQNI